MLTKLTNSSVSRQKLSKNGYEPLKCKRLIDFKLVYSEDFGNEIDFTTRTSVLGIFNFRALLELICCASVWGQQRHDRETRKE